MTQLEIRAEAAELINSGILNVNKIKSYFKTHRPDADSKTVAKEATELVAQTRMVIKKGY